MQVGEEVEAVRSDGQGGFEEGRMDPGRRKARWVSDVEIGCSRVARGGFCKVLRRDWRLEKWDEHCVFVRRYCPYRGPCSSNGGVCGMMRRAC